MKCEAGQNTTTYTYDPAGHVGSVTYPNGVQSTFTYDPQYRLTQMPTAKGATPLARYDYTVSPSGQRSTAVERSGRSVSWSYDNGWRMTSETISSDPAGRNGALTYSPDAVGNRLSRNSTLAGLGPQSLSYNADDQLAGETYDGNGNTVSSSGKTFAYDFENRLKSVNGGAVVMGYDGDGHRVSKTVGGVTTKYLVDDLNPTGYAQVVEEIVGGAVQKVYTHGIQRLSQSLLADGTWQTSFYGYDATNGSVRQLYDAAGAVTDTYDYDGFGSLIASTGTTANAYQYRGEQFDSDAGLYYLRARWYNPATGRFLTRDPAEGVLDRPASLNPYVYAEADPVNNTDPLGLYVQEPPTRTGGGGKGILGLAEYLITVVAPLAQRYIVPVVYYSSAGIAGQQVFVNYTSWSVLCVLDAADSLLDIAAQGQWGLPVPRRGCRFEVQRQSSPEPKPEPEPECGGGPCKEFTRDYCKNNDCTSKKKVCYQTKDSFRNAVPRPQYHIITLADYVTGVATNGYHEGILDETRGRVYDNIHPAGISYARWIGPEFRVGWPGDSVGKMFVEAESAGIGRIRTVQPTQA
ncbi:MAG: RHS repeat-associated core domain-containing protein, partial [Vicinamibacteria bacterium]